VLYVDFVYIMADSVEYGFLRVWVLNWVTQRFARGRERSSDIFLKSRVMASKLLFCFFVYFWG